MVKPMRDRELVKLRRAAGFTARQGKGDHEVWRKGDGQVSITQTREISPALARNALQAIERSKS